MAMTLPKRNISDMENKLRVLWCIDALGMVTQEQLWPFVAELDLMDYLSMCIYVDELTSDQAISVGVEALAGVLFVSDEGRRLLSLFSHKMPKSDRDTICAQASIYMAKLNEQRQVRVVHQSAPKGKHGLALLIKESDVPTLQLHIVADHQRDASNAFARAKDQAPALMTMFYTLPIHDQVMGEAIQIVHSTQEEALQACTLEKPLLCAHGKYEHSAIVALEAEGIHCKIALFLPTQADANAWLLYVVNHAKEVMALIGEKLWK